MTHLHRRACVPVTRRCPAFIFLLLALCGVSPRALALAGNCLLTLRIWWITRNGKLVCLLISRVAPVMLYISTFILIVMYMFAVVGMELFGPHKQRKQQGMGEILTNVLCRGPSLAQEAGNRCPSCYVWTNRSSCIMPFVFP